MTMEIAELRNEFVERFGESDEKIEVYFSPGRVNLIGEHTDYNGGYVFPCALSFGTYILLRKTADNAIKFRSLNQEFAIDVNLNELQKAIDGEWVNYPLGVFDQFIKKGYSFDFGLEILFWGNVPNGAGLSSSASIEMVTAFALNDLLGTGLDKIELVKMAQKAENEFVGVNCGIMDQFASGMGKENHAIFLNCDTLEYELVPLQLNGVKVVISNTNSPHKLDAGQYNQRVAECKTAVSEISKVKEIKLLGELNQDEFNSVEASIADATARKRARHVVSEIQRTVDAVDALKKGDLEIFGRLMNASHDSLREDYEVTGKELDTMVEEARKIKGVIGSRMTGAGFGGCTVSLVKEENIDEYVKLVGENYEKKTGIKPEFYIADIGDGTKKITDI